MVQLEAIFRRVVQILGILFSGALLLQGLFSMCILRMYSDEPFYISNRWWTQVIGICIFAMLIGLCMKGKVHDWLSQYGKFLFGGSLVLVSIFLVAWVFGTQLEPCKDMQDIYECANALLRNDSTPFLKGGKAFLYPFQCGTILLTAGVLKICTIKQSIYFFYLLSILAWASMVSALFFTCNLLYEDKALVALQGLLVVWYLPYAFLLMQLYNDHLGYGLAIWGIYFSIRYLKKRSVINLVLAFAFVAMGMWFKQNAVMILIGIIILLGFDLIEKKKLISKKSIVLILLTVSVFMISSAPVWIVSGMTGVPKMQGNSKWGWIAMGLTECANHAPGWYDGTNDGFFILNDYDKEKAGKAAREAAFASLEGFVKDRNYAFRFFGRKLATEWNNPTFECFSVQTGKSALVEPIGFIKSTMNDGGKINMLLLYIWDLEQAVVYAGLLLYFVNLKKEKMAELIPVVLFIGAFVFWTFMETKARYVAPFFLIMMPNAIMGYRNLFLQRKERRNKCAVATIIIVVVLLCIIRQGPGALFFKLHENTEAYYEYIQENHNNFEWLRY